MNTATTGAPQLPPGTVIDGTYTTGAVVRSRLGAVTYEATDLSGARVGVTVYAPECFVSPVALERGLRELRQVEKVHAPQVLRILDAGKLPKGGIYEVHENVSGPSLAEVAVPRDEVAALVHDIVAGLQAAQKVGVLHRNLGAEAILRVPKGIKLTGFAVGDPQGGVSFGSLDCISPEQVEGKNIDERTLVYNLAALTYRLLRGASLFTGGDTGTQLLQAAASLPAPESMPPALFAALAKDPKARPNLLAKFLGDLDTIIREFPDTPAPPAAREPSAPVRAAEPEPPPAPLFSLDPLPDDTAVDLEARPAPLAAAPVEEQVRPSPVLEAPVREAAAVPANANNRASATSDERDDDATLDALMADNDAPKLPSKPESPAPAAKPANPVAAPPAASGSPSPATAPAAAPKAPVTAPPSLAKPAVGAPTLAAKPTLAPPPGLKPAVPTIGAPPGLGKPAVPTIGAPPSLSVPTIGAPSIGAPTLSAPTLSAPTLSAPTLAAPAAPAPATSAAPPAVAAAPAAGAAKPRTRGWTMFMEVTEDEANTSPAPGLPQAGAPVPTPAPVASAAPVPAPLPAPTQAAAPAAKGEVKPSTRGWTMIMDEPGDADASALTLTNPAAAVTTPVPPSPTTRGWTMLEELNDSLPAGATPVTAQPSPATPSAGVATEPSGVSNAPSSRGWTMFMEAELQGKAEEPGAGEPAEVEPEEFEGELTTETGTVVAFAPTAAEPNASFRREPDLSAQEPMTSFGARLRGEPESVKPGKLDDEIPQPRTAPLESVPSPSAEIPSFADNNLSLIPVDTGKPPAVKVQPIEPDPIDAEPTEGGGNTKMIVGLLVVLAIVVAIIYAMS